MRKRCGGHGIQLLKEVDPLISWGEKTGVGKNVKKRWKGIKKNFEKTEKEVFLSKTGHKKNAQNCPSLVHF